MKYTDDSVVQNNITTYKCLVAKTTMLFKPSQAESCTNVLKYKIQQTGIILNKNKTVDIVEEDTVNNIEWLVVVYNNKYYYVPKSDIDTTKTVDIVDNPLSASSNNNVDNTTADWERVILYGWDNYLIAEAKVDMTLYDYPSTSANNIGTIKAGQKFIIQSSWINNKTHALFLCTQTFSIGSAYCLDNNSHYTFRKNMNNGGIGYYSIIDKDSVNGDYLAGISSVTYNKGDLIWAVWQDWDYGTIAVTARDPNNENGVRVITIPANKCAPLANSSDMINKSYFGTLTFNQSGVGYEVHTLSGSNINMMSSNSIYYLNNVSVAAFTRNSYAVNIAKNGFDKTVTAASKPNSHKILTGSTMIVTNKVSIDNINYYVGYFESTNKNGPIYYVIVRNMGDSYMEYLEMNQLSAISSNFPTNNESGYIEDNNYLYDGEHAYTSTSDKVNVVPDTVKADNGNNVYGIKLKVDDSKLNIPGINKDAPETPPEYNGWGILNDAEAYNLSAEMPYDTKHLTHINRFHLPTNNGMLSTKSFIFVTRPDLNIYKEILNEETLTTTVDTTSMNPDLKRQPGFKYIGRLRGTKESPGIGTRIMSSLEYWGTENSSVFDTPWLSVITNQARGYTINDRAIDTVDIAETFHGNRVVYAEPTFKHKVADSVSIAFDERRDLTLYFTLRLWIEYIQAVSMGYCSPRYVNKMNGILDYAVSLYYITTDETMENILYWEKLTGLIPLIVPDSFFEWTDSPARDMRYNITFAYSFRSVLDEVHLSEINNLYNRNKKSVTGMPLVPKNNFYYVNDPKYNNHIARLVTSVQETGISNDENRMQSFLNDENLLKKYYYGGIYNNGVLSDHHTVRTDKTSSMQADFLPNWNIYTQTYGIPYVKGPFIDHDPDAEKYILRWV